MKAVWYWYRTKNRFVKFIIVFSVVGLIGAVIDATDGRTSYEELKQGDCYSEIHFASDLSFTDVSSVDCSQPHRGKVVYVESFESRDFPYSWEQYANDNCPLSATDYFYPMKRSLLYEEILICVVEQNTQNTDA